MENGVDRISEIERLARDNNRMLHAMRRNAFWGGIFKFLIYVACMVVLPWWAYQTYLSPIVGTLHATVTKVQGTKGAAQESLGNIQDIIKQAQDKLKELQSTPAR